MPVLIALALIVLLVIVGVSVLGAIANLLWYLIVGLVVGALARLVVPGEQHLGWITTALFGIAGALVGGIAADALGFETIGGLVLSVLTAAALIAVFAGSFGGRERIRN